MSKLKCGATMEWGNNADEIDVDFTFHYSSDPLVEDIHAFNEHGVEIRMTEEMEKEAEAVCLGYTETYEAERAERLQGLYEEAMERKGDELRERRLSNG